MSDKQNGNSFSGIADFPGTKGSETNPLGGIGNLLGGLQPGEISGPLSLKSCWGKYLSACPDGRLEWIRDWDRDWEQFKTEPLGGGRTALKSCHGRYLSVKNDETVQCDQQKVSENEAWTVERTGDGIALKSCFGKYLHPESDGRVRADRGQVTGEETFAVTDHSKEGK
ncbi:MAG: DUF569 domain-containing protein [Treponema sp.]|jgi:hypothetical protein|nr:DUF569 domain-containing protein [Treponema sp.]